MTKIFPAPEEVRDINDDNANTEKRSCLHVRTYLRSTSRELWERRRPQTIGRERTRPVKRNRRKINSVMTNETGEEKKREGKDRDSFVLT